MTQQTDTSWRLAPMAAWEQLRRGDDRFVAGRPEHPGQDAAKRAEISARQWPCAIIVGCNDSRVAAEIIFDQGFGDLFVVRTAGHVVDSSVLGSIEFGVSVLDQPGPHGGMVETGGVHPGGFTGLPEPGPATQELPQPDVAALPDCSFFGVGGEGRSGVREDGGELGDDRNTCLEGVVWCGFLIAWFRRSFKRSGRRFSVVSSSPTPQLRRERIATRPLGGWPPTVVSGRGAAGT